MAKTDETWRSDRLEEINDMIEGAEWSSIRDIYLELSSLHAIIRGCSLDDPTIPREDYPARLRAILRRLAELAVSHGTRAGVTTETITLNPFAGPAAVKSAEVRAPVQPTYVRDPAKRRPWGSITREEHEAIHQAYAARGHSQSAERIALRGGFGYEEIVHLTGHPPKTWREEPDAVHWPGYKEVAS